MRDWNIRSASLSDIDSVLSLWQEFMGDSAATDEPIPVHDENKKRQSEFLQALIKQDARQVLVAEKGKDLIGYIAYEMEQRLPIELQRKRSFIHDLYVKPGERGLGVGRTLLRTCLDILEETGPRQVRIAVWIRNAKAIALYRSMGFDDHLLILKKHTR